MLAEHARQGLAILFTTSEIDECFSIGHRTVVMRRGRLAEFGPDAEKSDVMAASGEVLTSSTRCHERNPP